MLGDVTVTTDMQLLKITSLLGTHHTYQPKKQRPWNHKYKPTCSTQLRLNPDDQQATINSRLYHQ